MSIQQSLTVRVGTILACGLLASCTAPQSLGTGQDAFKASPVVAASPTASVVAAASGVAMPDARLTPGAVFDVTAAQVCVPGYSKSVRDVTTATKDQVYKTYGITSHAEGQYEIDHLVPLEIGGSNDIRNLWPEPAEPRPGFHEKDKLEDALHALICNGKLEIGEAQQEVMRDWYLSYRVRVLGGSPTASVGTGTATPAPTSAATTRPTAQPTPPSLPAENSSQWSSCPVPRTRRTARPPR